MKALLVAAVVYGSGPSPVILDNYAAAPAVHAFTHPPPVFKNDGVASGSYRFEIQPTNK